MRTNTVIFQYQLKSLRVNAYKVIEVADKKMVDMHDDTIFILKACQENAKGWSTRAMYVCSEYVNASMSRRRSDSTH